MKHGFCPYFLNKEVKDSFNEIIEALGGIPMTEEEFRNVELRKQRTGRNLSAMNAAYRIWELNKGNLIDLAPNGNPSILFNTFLEYYAGDRTKAIIAKAKVYSDQFIDWFGDWTNQPVSGVHVKTQKDGTIRLQLDSHTKDKAREIKIEPLGNNKYYVHIRIWDGEKIPGEISKEDKLALFDALYKQLPDGAEILFPKSGKGYYATRGTVAALMRLSRDSRFEKGSPGQLEFEDGEGGPIKIYNGTSFIKKPSVSKVVDENGEPLVVYHSTTKDFTEFRMDSPNRVFPNITEPFGHVGSFESANKIKGNKLILFANLRNPLLIPDFVHQTVSTMLKELFKQGIITKEESTKNISNQKLRTLLNSKGYDSIIYDNKAERGGFSYGFTNPNQIKSATDNKGAFSSENNDIYGKRPYIKPETNGVSIITQDDLLDSKSKFNELDAIVSSDKFKDLKALLIYTLNGYTFLIPIEIPNILKKLFESFKKTFNELGYKLVYKKKIYNNKIYHVAKLNKKEDISELSENVINKDLAYYRKDKQLMIQELKNLNGFYEKLLDRQSYSNSEESLIDYIQLNSDEEVTRGELGVDKSQLIALLGSTMYKANVQSVAVKELLQNAFDAVKIAMSTNAINKGVIDIWLNRKDRTVTVKDNGTGMTPEIVQKAFFTIGGSYKGDNVDNRLKSGGLGLAKMAFLFSSDYVEVSTVKNGVKTYVKATPEQIQSESGFDITTSRTNEPNGTQVTVKIPESYVDENENTRSIWFESSPSFLDKPMIGNVQLNVHTTNVWNDSTEDKSYDKSGIPEGYGYIGKATTDFGDMDLYIRHIGGKTNYINCSILISGLYQFNHNILMRDGGERVEIIANILPTVGVKSKLYPINNLREGFRSVVEPEIKDLDFLLRRISNVLQRKSIVAAFLGTVSMDVKDVSRPQRVVDKKAMLDDVLKDIKREIKLASTEKSNDDNTLDFKAVRSIRENSEKERSSSFNASGIKLNDQQAQIDTSHLDINKPLFHNNTTMEIEEDGRLFLNALGELLMELKQLYIQTYSSDKELVSRFDNLQVCEYISKQFWGFSFDKNYGGVNVHPSVLPLLSINPFYVVPRANESNKLTYLVGAIMHLIHHEFNHNYVSGEGAAFTGRFLSTLAEFYGIGKSFTKDWLNKLYKLVNENINVIIKYHERYTNSENRGESFESDRIGGPTESRNTSEQGLFEDVSRDRSREDVSSYGEEVRDLYREVQKAKTRQRKPYVRPETISATMNLSEDIMSLSNPDSNSPRIRTQEVIENNKKTHDTLVKKMMSLYRQYKQLKTKSATKQRTQNAIFELNNKIRHLELLNTIAEILDFISNKIGYEDVGRLVLNTNSIMYYLKQLKESGFDNITSEQLMDMYKNVILPLGSILQDINQDDIFTEYPGISASDMERTNEIFKKCKDALDSVTSLWTEAMFVVSDKIVDKIIDREVFLPENESKEEMRDVVKDFLHKTLSTGDITSFEYLISNFGRSRNPIIKQAFHLITTQEAQTRRELIPIQTKIFKAYKKADSIFKQSDWQSVMLEMNRKGIPTGNFVRPINYGQYELDLNDFIKKLNELFDNVYKHHYYYDNNDVLINSVTKEDASDEQWVNNVPPPIVVYWKAIYTWKCIHANLRYTKDYYLERLSLPYDSDENPLNTNGKVQKHGLSPKTMILYNEILSKINYYLDLCIEDDGYSHPENLDPESKKKLNDAYDELAELSNPFEPNGFTVKPLEQRKVAYEILSWLKFINEKTHTTADIEEFNKLANEVHRKSIAAGNQKLYNDFVKYNARFTINPEYTTMVFGNNLDVDETNSILYKARLTKSALNALTNVSSDAVVLVNGKPIITKNLSRFENDIEFWKMCKMVDEIIEELRTKRDKDFVERLLKFFEFKNLPYVNPYGNIVDKTTGQDTNDLNKSLSFVDYIIEKYTDIAEQNGNIPGVVDNNNNLIAFTGSRDQIKNQVTELFTYEREFYDENLRAYVKQRVPLSIFTTMLPSQSDFINPRTGKKEQTILYYPVRLFTKKENKIGANYMNEHFDHTLNVAELPIESIYDNSKAYDKMRKMCGDYYDTLIDAMKYAWSLYDPEKRFNYRAPLINAANAQILSRLLTFGYENIAKYFIDSISHIQANDEYAVSVDELIKGPDGKLIKTLPTRFVRPLKDPGTISYSLMETVILFVENALNYKNKNSIRNDIELLALAIADTSQRVGSNEQSVKHFNAMLNRHFYQMLLGDSENQSANRVVYEKIARMLLEITTKQMLGLNLMSASVGFGDSMLSLILDSFGLKYSTPLEGIRATWLVLYRIPAIIHNIGNPLPNNKVSALMQLFSLNGSTRNMLKYANRNQVRRGFKDFLMSPFQAGDYISRCIILTQYMMDILFYKGDGINIKPGFYTRENLKNIMYANGYKHSDFWKARNTKNISLWDMYHFNRDESFAEITKDNNLQQYVPYVNDFLLNNLSTRSQQRSALANGMNPDNDSPVWKSKIIGMFIGMMRSFIAQRGQNQFVAGNETVLREPYLDNKETVSRGITRLIKLTSKLPKYTDEQRYRRASWNYETGTTNDAAGIALFRALETFRKKAVRFFKFDFGGMKSAKYSPTEIYGARNAGIVLIMLAAMLSTWPVIHDWAASVAVPPKDRKEAGMTDLSYLKDRFINDKLWAMYIDDLAFRLIESQLTTIDPRTLYGLLGQITTLSSGLENTLKPVKFFVWDNLISSKPKHTPDEVIKDSGAFKYYTYKERSLFYLFGPLRNLHTSTSYYGLKYNEKYYVDTYGYIYDFAGYDYKESYPKKKKVSEMDSDELREHFSELAEQQREKIEELREKQRSKN